VYDEFDSGVAFGFEELADHLLEQGLQSSPSALHGCLCGLLSAGASHQQEYSLDALAGAMDLVVHGELAERVMQLYTVTAAALQDETFDFHLLLPDDDTDMAVRVEALADWCKSFLAGFAHAGVGGDGTPPVLSADSSEILEDIAAIAQAGLEEQDDEEDAERSFMELVEYLRFATLNVYLENTEGAGEQTPNPASLH
jgi:uncharacterized protein YgfB (UPF0149 family)